jgi:hypothetical protein
MVVIDGVGLVVGKKFAKSDFFAFQSGLNGRKVAFCDFFTIRPSGHPNLT